MQSCREHTLNCLNGLRSLLVGNLLGPRGIVHKGDTIGSGSMPKVLTLTLIAPNRKPTLEKGRWVALLLVLVSTLLLTSGNVYLQWPGWVVGAIASVGWGYFAKLDKDTPRMLMEVFYVLVSLWGVYNWI